MDVKLVIYQSTAVILKSHKWNFPNPGKLSFIICSRFLVMTSSRYPSSPLIQVGLRGSSLSTEVQTSLLQLLSGDTDAFPGLGLSWGLLPVGDVWNTSLGKLLSLNWLLSRRTLLSVCCSTFNTLKNYRTALYVPVESGTTSLIPVTMFLPPLSPPRNAQQWAEQTQTSLLGLAQHV